MQARVHCATLHCAPPRSLLVKKRWGAQTESRSAGTALVETQACLAVAAISLPKQHVLDGIQLPVSRFHPVLHKHISDTGTHTECWAR